MKKTVKGIGVEATKWAGHGKEKIYFTLEVSACGSKKANRIEWDCQKEDFIYSTRDSFFRSPTLNNLECEEWEVAIKEAFELVEATEEAKIEAPKEKRIEQIKEEIIRDGIESTYWSTFDAYAQVVGGKEWEKAVEKLPASIQAGINEQGLDACLDWDYWGSSSFFELTFTNEKAGDFYEKDSSAYIEALNSIEEAMWECTKNDADFEAFSTAYNSADNFPGSKAFDKAQEEATEEAPNALTLVWKTQASHAATHETHESIESAVKEFKIALEGLYSHRGGMVAILGEAQVILSWEEHISGGFGRGTAWTEVNPEENLDRECENEGCCWHEEENGQMCEDCERAGLDMVLDFLLS